MRPSHICNACISRSVQYPSHSVVQFRNSADRFPRKSLRQITTQTGKPKHLASAATNNAQRGQKWAHASVASERAPRLPAGASQEALTASPPQHLISTTPHPENNLSSTRPARLDSPEGPIKDEGGAITLKNRASYLFQLGKAYARFYKTGLKNIWSNYKEYRDLRRKLGGAEIHDLVRYASTPAITRREFQLHLRTQHDLKKLIPFGLVFAICGEFTPLVIVALGTAVVPYTCRIPKQVKKDLQKALSRTEDVERLSPQKTEVGITPALGYAHGVDPLGLSIRETPVLGSLLQRFWVEPKLKQRMDHIICDAKLINHEGGAARLEPEELYQFCVDIRQLDAMKRMVDYYTHDRQSDIPDPDVKHTQKELQVFLDSIGRKLTNLKSPADYNPESIFVAAAKYVRSRGQEGPYIPPQTLRRSNIGDK
ncbi:hypothetical protein EPUS_07304 [Endocarpon pusillum Z07020]|uniref:Letm1 RBD domain-containing protein n=1 Tax=Endocarpon pusillum (strain Z07020 / HMAS-L-300199) TaxID=1263415 RepID=U1I334_ENDPU|nr:uncharacterized protein EPUS_07304 [Endocarpon pusillum Z07020]ERF76424.1 hypothetical protein EPUS_07304 [Endocarpon pusillum Z07020]